MKIIRLIKNKNLYSDFLFLLFINSEVKHYFPKKKKRKFTSCNSQYNQQNIRFPKQILRKELRKKERKIQEQFRIAIHFHMIAIFPAKKEENKTKIFLNSLPINFIIIRRYDTHTLYSFSFVLCN